MNALETAKQVIMSPKVEVPVVTITPSTGLLAWLEYIPADIAKLTALIGVPLSFMYMYIAILNVKLKRIELEEAKNRIKNDE